MAERTPPFRPAFPLLLTSTLLLAQPMTAFASGQVQCRAGSDGGWACAPMQAGKTLPPRPQHIQSLLPAASAPVTPAIARSMPEQPSSNRFSDLDWVPREQLSPEQQAGIAAYCRGTYVEPPREGREDQTPFAELPIQASADSSSFDQESRTGSLEGNVDLRQGRLQARADSASFDQDQAEVRLTGNVRLRDQGVLVLGESAQMQVDTGEVRIDDVRYVVHEAHARGDARKLMRRDDAVIVMADGSFTTCEPEENTWSLRGKDIELDREKGWGEAKHVTLRIKDIPVFYTPYLYFPIDDRRHSGLLVPSLSYSRDSGSSLTTPYYFNLAPNYDATLYPTLMSDRGLQLEGEFRYLSPNSEGQIGASVLDDRDEQRKLQSKYKNQRWMYSWQHVTDFSPRLRGSLDYTDISDPYYFQDLDTYLGIQSGSFLDQRASLNWLGDNNRAALNLHTFKRASITEITPYERVPQLTLDGSLPFQPGGLRFNYSGEFVSFQRDLMTGFYTGQNGLPENPWYDDRLQGLTRAEGERLHLEPSISMPLSRSWGFVNPSVKYAYTRYLLSLDEQGKATLDVAANERFLRNQNRGVPILSVDSGLYFDRSAKLFGNDYTQTLEPRLHYLYVPNRNQDDIPVFDTSEAGFSYASLWRDNRFSGRDRIGDANQLSVGITHRWIEANGFERQRFSIGQAFHGNDRKVTMPDLSGSFARRSDNTDSSSPYALEYLYRFNRDWRFNLDLVQERSLGNTRSGSAMWHYQPENNPRKIVNLGYRYRNDTLRFDTTSGRWTYNPDFGTPGSPDYIPNYYKIDQHDFSFMWPINPQWSLVGRWQHDYGRNRTLEAFGGFEYDSCCWKLRVINRYWIDYDETSLNPRRNDDPDRGIFLQIVFKGLGNVAGNGLESLLNESIPGFKERENNAL